MNFSLLGRSLTIFVVILVSLLFMNLFAGIVVTAFKKEREILSYNYMLHPIQRDFIELQLKATKAKPLKGLE